MDWKFLCIFSCVLWTYRLIIFEFMDSFLQPKSFLKFSSTIILHFFFMNINSACNESHFSICMIFSNQLAHFYLIFFLFSITSSIFDCVCSIIYFLSLFSKWSSFLWQHFFPTVSFLSSTMWYFPLFCFFSTRISTGLF